MLSNTSSGYEGYSILNSVKPALDVLLAAPAVFAVSTEIMSNSTPKTNTPFKWQIYTNNNARVATKLPSATLAHRQHARSRLYHNAKRVDGAINSLNALSNKLKAIRRALPLIRKDGELADNAAPMVAPAAGVGVVSNAPTPLPFAVINQVGPNVPLIAAHNNASLSIVSCESHIHASKRAASTRAMC